ncbi:hypothetical protein EYF80_054534 [Liparis tanakae]|uniref:Uncharacterized protein n=1 Tax=Liparis tanakae TaxID=230148 RepID=A0A4Z2F2E2_9TELE|nr:hypothetical protein EYF80_054534 [Liparis tanakae]
MDGTVLSSGTTKSRSITQRGTPDEVGGLCRACRGNSRHIDGPAFVRLAIAHEGKLYGAASSI